MNRRFILGAAGAFVLASAFGYGAYRLGVSEGGRKAVAIQAAPGAGSSAVDRTDKTGKRVLYWHDPMVPGQKFDKPGKSPFMDMDLVPVYADDAQAEGTVNVSPGVQQKLGVRIVEVKKGSAAIGLQAVGNVAFNERDVAVVQARSNGFVERLYVRAPLDAVRKGQPLLQLYVPDWVAAQEEYLAIKRMPASANTEGLLDAALQRMRLAGMTDEQIRQVVARGSVSPRITLTAPVGGVITDLAAREGMTVAAGAPLFRISGLRTVWVNAEVPEAAAAQVRPGLPVQARTPAFPGTTFSGKVESLLPDVNAATRTLKARVELANPDGKLVPGMFATVRLSPAASQDVLLVPSEAVIQTGTRTVVITALGGGRFAPVEVVLGAESNGQAEVREGLSAGQKVVASGQFLIDSEASLRGTLRRLDEPAQAVDLAKPTPKPTSKPAPTATTHHATGKVEQIAPDAVTISHGPIPSLKWGPMTMGFSPPAGGMPRDIAVGDMVDFEIQAGSDGMFKIVAITPAKGRNAGQGARQ
jgi:Cu(I)/Ag(I) efflux system membrane fusion protein